MGALPSGMQQTLALHPDAVFDSGTIADDTATTIVTAPGAGQTVMFYLTVYQTGATQSEVLVSCGNHDLRYPLAAGFGAGADVSLSLPVVVTAAVGVILTATVATAYSWNVGYVTLVL